ncbi:hypothetical protein [Micromonospora radicis]|uniref:Uncharacterized protein n=1 Tax=Micromonospora radicis TaxID=1894971 RepID=A0A418MNU0_9ACTN|nr:hypothetical protein [Micromonospora radicis]RIV32718.1 hypothetical protein D2L64_24445 [Micromonospora radicis]
MDNTPEVAAEVKDNLSLLMSLAEAKGKAYEDEIQQDLLLGKTSDNLTIAITKIVSKRTEFRAYTKSDTTNIVNEVKNSLAKIFSGDPQIMEGIAGVVGTALTAIIGAGEGQESEARYYAVAVDYPAIVRFDFAFWGRNIRAQSIKSYMESVLTCVAFKSAVDLSKLAFNDFLALYAPILNQAYGGDQKKINQMVKNAADIYGLYKVPLASASAAANSSPERLQAAGTPHVRLRSWEAVDHTSI